MKFAHSLTLASAVTSAYAAAFDYSTEKSRARAQRMTLPDHDLPLASYSRVEGGFGAQEVTEMQAKHNLDLGAKRVKIRYGPYTIPSVDGGAIGKVLDSTGGMIWNAPHKNVRKPCSDCMLTYMHAGMELPDGRSVNTNDGLWLHHMVALNRNGRADATCGLNPASLPHIDVGYASAMSERFFSSGNERTVVDVNAWSPRNVGYYVGNRDAFSFIVDLMNENKHAQKVYMTITWEFVPGRPSGWQDVRPVWFDADQCGVSDVRPKSESEPYVISARKWTANFNGKVIAMGSHLHDGGNKVEIIKNDQVLCTSTAKYGETPEYHSKAMGGAMSRMNGGDMTHISSIKICGNTPDNPDAVGDIKKGDVWQIKGYYDYTKHPGMLNGRGKQAEVRAIVIMYTAVPMSSRKGME